MTYWVASALLIVFGVITGFSIGPPFFIAGIAMVLLAPLRRRVVFGRRIFGPLLAALIVADVGYWLTIPFSCTASSSTGGGPTTVVCTSLLGLHWPATAAGPDPGAGALGLAVALLGGGAALMVGLLLQGRGRPSRAGRDDL